MLDAISEESLSVHVCLHLRGFTDGAVILVNDNDFVVLHLVHLLVAHLSIALYDKNENVR